MDTKNAPVGAAHFVSLARQGVYEGSRWHRIIKNFVVQGGAPDGEPEKPYGDSVQAEIPERSYKIGDLAAAKGADDPPGTFDSQFFIITGKQGVALPRDYAVFGHLTSGMDVVKKLLALTVDSNGDPRADPSQKEATIDKVTITASDQPAGTTSSAVTTSSRP
jgi:cyclophilin family peptidyl-prolyl cis-trans isomerase